MRLDDKLAALDNHAARRMHVSEWQHLRTLAAAEGDSRIVAECDYRIAKLTARTRAQEAMRVVDEARAMLGREIPMGAEIGVSSGTEHSIAATSTGKVLRVTISILVEDPDAEFFQ